MGLFYNFLIRIYLLGIRLASLFNPKAKQWLKGRKDLFRKLQSSIDTSSPVAWFHAASLGEFEQGRPVIEAYRLKFPDHKILLTFFSPSGYEIRKNYEGADYIFYLPLDTRRNARRFARIVKPHRAFFIKYEYWYNYLSVLKRTGTPVYILSANFRPSQYFFKWYAAWFRKILMDISCIFVQNEQSEKLLRKFGINNCMLSGDTRFDRVFEAARHKNSFPLVEKFCGASKVLLMGSSWPEDEALLYRMIREDMPEIKVIIVPHEVNEEHIKEIIEKLTIPSVRFSELTGENARNFTVLIVDTIGILLHLYQYATVAYIGGGFGKGIHNILEAACFGKPVIFGPNYKKFLEAIDLIQLGGAFTFHNYLDLKKKLMELLAHPDHYKNASHICSDYVLRQRGATERILKYVEACNLSLGPFNAV